MSQLFVGLGGTGCGVLQKLSRKITSDLKFKESLNTPKKDVVLWGIDADEIQFDVGVPSVVTELKVIKPAAIQNRRYTTSPEFRKWFDPVFRTAGHINSPDSPGAGQIKMNGRFAVYQCFTEIQTALGTVKGLLERTEDAAVNIITSLFGGTGAGMLFDIAYLINKDLSNDIRFFLLEPSFLQVFDPGGTEVHSWNGAYASLIELDYWLTNDETRTKDRIFNMTYSDGTTIESSAPPTKGVILFGGTDTRGRSLAQTGRRVHDAYQEFMASVLFEISFHSNFKRYFSKNILDNIDISPDATGHSTMFFGFGLAYLRFPIEKAIDYAKNYCIAEFLLPKFEICNRPPDDIRGAAEHFLVKEVKISEREYHLLTTKLKDFKSVKSLNNAVDAHKKQIKAADDREKISSKQPSFDFGAYKQDVDRLIQALVEGSGDVRGFTVLLNESIISRLKAGEYILDILAFIHQIEALLSADLQFFKKVNAIKHENYLKQQLEQKFKDQYQRLRATEDSLFSFGKRFEKAKGLYLKILSGYIEGAKIECYYGPVVHLYESLIVECQSWVNALRYFQQRILDVLGGCKINKDKAFARLRTGLFIYDDVLAGQSQKYLSELHIGDNAKVVDKYMMKGDGKIIEKFQNKLEVRDRDKTEPGEIMQGLILGHGSVSGFKDIIDEIKEDDPKHLNDMSTKTDFQKKIGTLVEELVEVPLKNIVSEITFENALTYQLEEIYSYVKDLYKNRTKKSTEYSRMQGKMMAMFGSEAASQLIEMSKTTGFDEWKNKAADNLIFNASKKVTPLWNITDEGVDDLNKRKRKYIIFPEGMEISEKFNNTREGIQEAENSKWHRDRITFLHVDYGIRLNQLDGDYLEDIRKEYEKEKRKKLKENSRRKPYHTDNRFYNEWEWDLVKDASQQMDTKTLERFAIALVLRSKDDDAALPIIHRKKMKSGYVFNYHPDELFQGKKQKRLGSSLAKSYEALNRDLELRQHFIEQIQQRLSRWIYSIPADSLESRIRELLREVQGNWQSLEPPERAGDKQSFSYAYWSKTNDRLDELADKINRENFEELLLK